jgi:hypothetical protein
LEFSSTSVPSRIHLQDMDNTIAPSEIYNDTPNVRTTCNFCDEIILTRTFNSYPTVLNQWRMRPLPIFLLTRRSYNLASLFLPSRCRVTYSHVAVNHLSRRGLAGHQLVLSYPLLIWARHRLRKRDTNSPIARKWMVKDIQLMTLIP